MEKAVLAILGSNDEDVCIEKYIQPNRITYIHAKKPRQAILELIELMKPAGIDVDLEEFFTAVMEREKIVSTAIGVGVAIPHAKLEFYKDFFILMGVQKEPGISWSALDGNPVRIVFLIGGPASRQKEYLQILSKITFIIKEEENRRKILKAASLDEIASVFKNF